MMTVLRSNIATDVLATEFVEGFVEVVTLSNSEEVTADKQLLELLARHHADEEDEEEDEITLLP